jgi:hypothetical protein
MNNYGQHCPGHSFWITLDLQIQPAFSNPAIGGVYRIIKYFYGES